MIGRGDGIQRDEEARLEVFFWRANPPRAHLVRASQKPKETNERAELACDTLWVTTERLVEVRPPPPRSPSRLMLPQFGPGQVPETGGATREQHVDDVEWQTHALHLPHPSRSNRCAYHTSADSPNSMFARACISSATGRSALFPMCPFSLCVLPFTG